MEPQKSPNSHRNLEKKNKGGGIMLPDIEQYYKAIIIKTEKNWHIYTHVDQLNRKESPAVNPHIYGQLTFD